MAPLCHRLWARLTATLCIFLIGTLDAQPLLAAVALVRPSAKQAAHNEQLASPTAASLPIASPSKLGTNVHESKRLACEARRLASSAGPGSAFAALTAPSQKNSDGGDAEFRRGLAQLFGATDEPHEQHRARPFNLYTDDECDEFDSPVPPLVRQIHPVIEDVGAPFSGWAYADRESTLTFEDVTLVIPAGAVLEDTRITIRTIPDRQAGALDEGMVNVTRGQRAVRLGPHGLFFQKPITVRLPYERRLIPGGMSEQDLGTFYFDGEAGRWRRVQVREVSEGDGVVVAETEHFTDFINATLATPDHPTTATFTQDTIAKLKVGDPAAGLELVSPPSASNDGAAHLTYRFNIPPGRHGMQPDLTLNYNSDAGNGWLGLGWDVGISKIQVDTRFGVPHYSPDNETELYTIDGAELSPKGATTGPKERALTPDARVAERSFARRMEGSFSTITRHGASPKEGDNAYWWEVVDKNGTRYLYGEDSASRLEAPGTGEIAEWGLSTVIDTFGNSIHYEYQFDSSNLGGATGQPWVQMYPKLIRYTDHPNSPAKLFLIFQLDDVDTAQHSSRSDAFSSAREGFVVRTARRLHAMAVVYSPDGVEPPPLVDDINADLIPLFVRRYLFNYIAGEYQKSLLDSVDVQELGNAHDVSATWNTLHRTSLSYYQRPAGESPSFAASASWGNIASNQLLSDSNADYGGTHGFTGAGICNQVHAGPSGGIQYGEGSTSQAFLDFNGDGLPDFLSRDQIFLGHRSASEPFVTQTSPFNDVFFKTLELSKSAGFEAHSGNDVASVGADWSWVQSIQHGGFTDVNGDGFVDWIRQDWSVLLNPSGGTTSGGVFQPPNAELDEETKEKLDQNSPRADTVVRWIAPYAGMVAFGGPIQRKEAQGGDVLAEVWRFAPGGPEWSHIFTAADMAVCTPGPGNSCSGGMTFKVDAGDRFYFRTRAQGDVTGTALLWDPQFSYQSICTDEINCSVVSLEQHTQTEPWGAPIFDFSQARDFRLAGRPDQGWRTQVAASNIPVTISGSLRKEPTADDVVLEIFRTNADNTVVTPIYSRKFGSGERNLIDLSDELAGKTILVSGTPDGANLAADSLHVRLRSDGPTDPTAFHWIDIYGNDAQPTVAYQQYCRTAADETASQVCGAVTCPAGDDTTVCQMTNDPLPQYPLLRGQVVQRLPVTYSAFQMMPAQTVAGNADFPRPTQSWPAPESGAFDATVTYSLGSWPATADEANTNLLIQGQGRLLGKVIVPPGTNSVATLKDLSVTANEPLYFTALRKGDSGFSYRVELRFPGTGHVYTVPLSALNSRRVQAWDDTAEGDNFSGGYHQWSTVQWTEIPPVDGQPPPPEFSPANVEAAPSDSAPVVPTFALPQGLPANQLEHLAGFAAPVWASSGEDFHIAAGEMKPSRAGGSPQTLALATSGPAFRKSHGWSREGGFALLAQFADSASGSSGDVETIDMNGDRYPDSFDGQTIRFGDSHGDFVNATPVGVSNGVREFTGHHRRFGIGGSASGGITQRVGAYGIASATVSVSSSGGQIYGRTRTKADLIDVNGDGLPDRIQRSDGKASVLVQLNLGYAFGPVFALSEVPRFTTQVPSDTSLFDTEDQDEGYLRLQTDVTNSVQAGGGISTGSSYSGGGGVAYTGTRTVVDLADVNGDGLPDRVLKVPGDNALRVELNLGESFAPEQVWDLPAWGSELPSGGPLGSLGSRDALSYTEGSEFHFDTGYSYEFPIYLFICGVVEAAAQYRRNHETSQLTFEDVDGDGFADQLLKNDGSGDVHVKLNRDGAAHFNLLKTVENPIGGRISLDYAREGNTPALPQNHWVLSSVSLDDGLSGALHDAPHTTTFQYSGGFYNRDERQSFGFAQVTTIRPDQSKLIQSFRQDAVCTNGLLGSSIEQDGQGHLFLGHQSVYDLRPAGAADSCFPAATQTITSFYDGVTTDASKPSKTRSEGRDYDAVGNVTFYSDAGDNGTLDDLSFTVSYDATLAASGIYRPSTITGLDATNHQLRKREATYYSNGSLKSLHDIVNGGHNPTDGTPYVNQATPDSSFTYDNFGNVQVSTDPTGFQLVYQYDGPTQSYPTLITDSFGYVSSSEVDPALGVATSVTDINGATELFTYSKATPRLTTVTAPAEFLAPGRPATIKITYSDLTPGLRTLPVSAVVEHYDVTSVVVDRNGVTNPGDPIVTATFIDGLGRTIQTKQEADANVGGVDSHGFRVSGLIVFDERGRVAAQGLPVFNTEAEDVLSTPALTQPTSYQYDILSRVTSVTEPNNGVIKTFYGFGQFDGVTRFTTKVTDPNNNSHTTYEDVRGQVVGVDQLNTIDGTDKILTTRYSYNPLGELLQVTDAKGNKTTSVYDTVGHLVDLTSPDSGHTSYRYELSGNLAAKQTPNLATSNSVIRFTYEFHRLTTIDLPGTPDLIDFTYNYGVSDDPDGERGRLTQIDDPSGHENRFYDSLGRIDVSEFTPTPQSKYAPKPTYTTKYNYDSLGRLLTLTYPDKEVVTYRYDSGGALLSVTGKPAGTGAADIPYVQKITYDELGQRHSLTLGNGAVTTYKYDPGMRWLTDINTVSGATTLQNLHYAPDLVGNILSAKNDIPIPAPVGANGPVAPGPVSQTFTYDKLYQLTSATGRYDGCACGCNNYRKYSFSQTYDEIGNIKNKTVTDNIYWPTGGRVDAQPKTTYNNGYTYAGPRPHAPTKIGAQTLNYDPNGNQTSSVGSFEVGREVTWNDLDQLTKEVDSSTTNTYVYNGTGERTHKRRGNQETVYVNQYYVIRSLLYQTKHIYAGPTRIASSVVTLNDYTKLTTTQTPILYYYHSDQLGSTGYTTDRTGQILEHEEYLPSGESWFEELRNNSSSNGLPWKFNGKELDETGLYYYGARYYNPRSGIWMSPDPILAQYVHENLGKGALEPRNLSLYGYSWNNPIMLRDPDGRCPQCAGVAVLIWGPEAVAAAAGTITVALETAGAAAVAGAGVLWVAIRGGSPPANTPAPAPASGAQPQVLPAPPAPVAPPADLPTPVETAPASAEAKGSGRTRAQERLRQIAEDPNTSSSDRGWIQQEQNAIERGQRPTIRNPPGKQLAHARGREAAKGYDHVESPSNLQDVDLHRTQHKFDKGGRANKERP